VPVLQLGYLIFVTLSGAEHSGSLGLFVSTSSTYGTEHTSVSSWTEPEWAFAP
jgi:hypothetical protein